MITENHKNSHSYAFLSKQQQKAIDLLLLGKTEKLVAEELEIARETLNRWRNHNSNFIAALSERQGLLTRRNNLFPWALDVIEQALAKSDSKVAIAVLQALAPSQASELQLGEITLELMLVAQAAKFIEEGSEHTTKAEDNSTARVTELSNRRLQTIETMPNPSLST